MRTIWKYTLDEADEQVIQIPAGAKPLYVGLQNAEVCLWLECDSEAPKEAIRVFIVGTGHPIHADARNYVGTVQVGMFVWHVYTEC